MLRLAPPAGLALLIVTSLFLLMHYMMRAPLIEGPEGIEVIENVELVEVEKEETPEEQLARLESLPPPPPAAPSGLSPVPIQKNAFPAAPNPP